jgi:hypothetical protein
MRNCTTNTARNDEDSDETDIKRSSSIPYVGADTVPKQEYDCCNGYLSTNVRTVLTRYIRTGACQGEDESCWSEILYFLN